MTVSKDLSFYTSQSLVTDPGRHAALFEDLPADVAFLANTARNLIIHYRAENPLKHGIAKTRLQEIHTRHVETMLTKLLELKDAPITAPRAPSERLVACCRDFTILFISMARAKGIPTRARIGFAKYFDPGFYCDHEVAEVWDDKEQHWYLVDPQLSDNYKSPHDGVSINRLNVPRDQFLVSGEAWKLSRAGTMDPKKFIVGPDVDIEETKGWPQIKHDLIQDLVALLKTEMLLWDEWATVDEKDYKRLDRIAELTMVPDVDVLKKLYDDDKDLQVPEVIDRFDPLGGPTRKVSWMIRG
ncbi:hypothetical protein BGZ83_007721 [Gryganskiella cystojenkinii]|nr:hypothetical protein BGZ83_007721 [Gryganskiella cystojenkinii]